MMREIGGGGYAGTDWNGYDVPYMWAMVAGQQTDVHWQHVAGWRRTAELASRHISTLQTYRNQLTEAWPPERNAAAQTYVAQLDYLISHVQATYDAATANYAALAAATSGLSTTRFQMEQIYNDYAANEQTIAQYQADLAAYEGKNAVEKLFTNKPTNPVSPQRQQELTWQARSLMFELSGTLSEARTEIKSPPAYSPPVPPRDTSEPRSGSTGGSSSLANPPFVPPIVPVPVEAPRSAPIAQPAAPSLAGPALAGIGPVVTGPGPGPAAPGMPAPPGPAPLPPGGVIGAPIPPLMPPRAVAPGGVIGGPLAPGAGAARPGITAPGARPLAPGGVIGGRPGVGVGRPGATATPRRVNPAGGVIGQSPGGRTAGAGPHGGAAGRPQGMVQATGQGRKPGAPARTGGGDASGRGAAKTAATGGQRRAEHEIHQRWDPENPWETEEGVPPVVLPPAEPRRHDPGPAIGSGA